jgi:hypothetical protein
VNGRRFRATTTHLGPRPSIPIISRPDLADRAILLTLDPISEEQKAFRRRALAGVRTGEASDPRCPARCAASSDFRSFSTMAIMRSRSQADMLVGSENLNVESLGRGS